MVLKMKMEREQNQEKLELCVKDGSKKEVKFKFKKQAYNGKTKYKGEIDNGVDADKVEFEVSIDAEGYKYTLRDQNGEQKGEQRQMRRGGYKDGEVCTADAEVNKPEGGELTILQVVAVLSLVQVAELNIKENKYVLKEEQKKLLFFKC